MQLEDGDGGAGWLVWRGGAVAVHCLGGINRSPLVLVYWSAGPGLLTPSRMHAGAVPSTMVLD